MTRCAGRAGLLKEAGVADTQKKGESCPMWLVGDGAEDSPRPCRLCLDFGLT